MGMTWRVRVRGLVIGFGILVALALASGADFTDAFSWLSW
jgi:hypothetical protein